jgi:hypothetical protein
LSKLQPPSQTLDDERRQSVRVGVRVWFKLAHREKEIVVDLSSVDLSQHGAFIASGGQNLPDIGEKILLQVQNKKDDAPFIRAKIVRKNSDGIAVIFLEPGT